MTDHTIQPELLTPYQQGDSLADRVNALLLQQLDAWAMARDGYTTLESVKTKTFLFDGFVVKVQFNPGRLASTTAKVDEQSLGARPCFLCERNLPAGQMGIPYAGEYIILVNPFPIFTEHFTIPHIDHVPQRIAGSFGTMIDLAAQLGSRYVTLYNGPQCGASAPDHLHFQAGTRSFIPIDFDYSIVKESKGRQIHQSHNLNVYAVDGYLRRFIAFESGSRDILAGTFRRFYDLYRSLSGSAEEPMMNILVFHDPEGWRVIVFPRAKHRPSHFYRPAPGRILLSPASIDLGGTCTIPVREDFERITREDIAGIFDEVCLASAPFNEIAALLADALRV